MRVRVNGRVWSMGEREAEELVEMARGCSDGIYAIRRGDYIELKDEPASPLMELEYEADGWEVYSN